MPCRYPHLHLYGPCAAGCTPEHGASSICSSNSLTRCVTWYNTTETARMWSQGWQVDSSTTIADTAQDTRLGPRTAQASPKSQNAGLERKRRAQTLPHHLGHSSGPSNWSVAESNGGTVLDRTQDPCTHSAPPVALTTAFRYNGHDHSGDYWKPYARRTAQATQCGKTPAKL